MRTLKFLSLLFIAVSVGFASCKKDDKEEAAPSNATAIVGKWQKTKEVETEYNSGGTKQGENTNSTFTAEDYVEYKSNGQCVVNEGISLTLTYQVSGSKITYKYGSFAYGEETIKTVNSTELVLEETDVEDNGSKFVTVTTYKKM